MIHFSFEGSFLYLSTFGRSVNTSVGPFAELCEYLPTSNFTRLTFCCLTAGKEYTRADARWGTSDPTVVSLEILTVLGAGPMCCYIVNQIVKNDPARHYWIVVLSTAELYGGYVASSAVQMFLRLKLGIGLGFFISWMTFCPEWLTGSPSLDTSNPLYLWVYLVVRISITFSVT